MALDKLSGNSFATGAIANSLGYTPVNKAGDTMTGNLTVPMVVTESSLGSRNMIINGAMNVKQRSETFLTGLTGYNKRVVDFHRTGGGNQTTGRHGIYVKNGVTPASGIYEAGACPPGFTNSLKYVVEVAEGTSTGGPLFHSTFVEGSIFSNANYGTSNAAVLTISFWVKSSVTGKFELHIHNNTSPQIMNRVSYTINSANTWERKSITITPPTTGTWPAGTDCGIRFDFVLKKDASSSSVTAENTWTTTDLSTLLPGTVSLFDTVNATLYFTGMQLEFGATATAFEHRPIGTELALCQRYFVRDLGPSDSNEGFPVQLVGGYTFPNNWYKWVTHALPVEMRAAPTIVWYPNYQSTSDSGKARYYTTNSAGGGNNLTPYGTMSTPKYIGLKAYNEHNSFTCYGFGAGYDASAEF